MMIYLSYPTDANLKATKGFCMN